VTALTELDWVRVPCALCGAEEPRELARVEAYAVPLTVVRCGGCGHVYLDPRPADGDLPKLYDEDYYTGSGDYTYSDDRASPEVARLRADARLERIEELVSPGRLLEVGCSFGAFLLAARSRGWEVRGVDLSPFAAKACEEAGLDVFRGELADAPPAEGRLDVVYLSETVEHLPDPRATVRAAARALRPGGLLVLATANHDSLARLLRGRRWGYYMPGHLQYFGARSLGRLLAEEGLPVARLHYGDSRTTAAMRAIRRATVGRAGFLATLKDAMTRLGVGGWSVGAGMVICGRKEG